MDQPLKWHKMCLSSAGFLCAPCYHEPSFPFGNCSFIEYSLGETVSQDPWIKLFRSSKANQTLFRNLSLGQRDMRTQNNWNWSFRSEQVTFFFLSAPQQQEPYNQTNNLKIHQSHRHGQTHVLLRPMRNLHQCDYSWARTNVVQSRDGYWCIHLLCSRVSILLSFRK